MNIADIENDQKQLYKLATNLLGNSYAPIFLNHAKQGETCKYLLEISGIISTILDQLAISKEDL